MDAKAKVVDVLRERYAPTEVPPCRVCGGRLSIAGIGGGKPTVWACSGNEDDPDRPGFIRSQPGRWGNAKEGVSEYGPGGHYHDFRWEDRRQGGDSQVIELIETYEKLLTDHEAALAELQEVIDTLVCTLNASTARHESRYATLLTGLEALAGEWEKKVRSQLGYGPSGGSTLLCAGELKERIRTLTNSVNGGA